MKRVKDKTIIVTGAAQGIGKATALLCAEHGAHVAVTDVNEGEGQKVVKEIQDNGGKAHFWHLDVRNEKEVQKVFSEIHAKFKKIDVLVNNAGIQSVNKPTDQITEEEWDSTMAVNVKGVFFCTKHVIPYMKENKRGSIINLSSIYGIAGGKDVPAYHVSKGAVRIMSKTDAMLYAKDNIRVNAVCPGYILTPLLEKNAASFKGGKEAYQERLDALEPLGHIGEPNDVAYGILYLASDESKFVTGSDLVIDGGYLAR